MRRRAVLLLSAGAASFVVTKCLADPEPWHMTLLDAPLEVKGDWGRSPPRSAANVLSRMRMACLSGVKLLSDRQPSRIRVENHATGSPAIWLHDDGSPMAWIIVDIGERDWSKLAYQFGHELGHVLANSWGRDSKPRNPCQWLEEALVEAFSLRGLGKLADSWKEHPPFTNDAPFAESVRQYQRRTIEKYEKIAAEQMQNSGLDAWFRTHRASLERDEGITGPAQALVTTILKQFEADERSIEDLGALNRWSGRTAVPMENYLRLWQDSCHEIGASGGLPKRISDLLGLR